MSRKRKPTRGRSECVIRTLFDLPPGLLWECVEALDLAALSDEAVEWIANRQLKVAEAEGGTGTMPKDWISGPKKGGGI